MQISPMVCFLSFLENMIRKEPIATISGAYRDGDRGLKSVSQLA